MKESINNQANAIEKQNLSLWYDDDTNKYFLINNETGETKNVAKTGESFKKYDPNVSGRMSFKERMEYSKKNEDFRPYIPESLNPKINRLFYTPTIEKLNNSTQFPRPLVKSINYKRNVLREGHNSYIEDFLNMKMNRSGFINEKNTRLFSKESRLNLTDISNDLNTTDYKASWHTTTTNNNNSLMYLTSSITRHKDLVKSQSYEINHLHNDRNNNNTNHHDDHNHKTRSISNSSKINNNEPAPKKKEADMDSSIIKPNIEQLTKIRNRLSKRKSLENRKSKDEDNSRTDIDLNTNLYKYENKINDVLNKTVVFSSTDSQIENMLNTIHTQKNNQMFNKEYLSKKLDNYTIKTFDKNVLMQKLRSSDNTENLERIKTEKYYLDKMNREIFELQEIEDSECPIKQKISSIRRFNSYIPTPEDQYKKDRELMKKSKQILCQSHIISSLVNPELYIIKENKAIHMNASRLTKKLKDNTNLSIND